MSEFSSCDRNHIPTKPELCTIFSVTDSLLIPRSGEQEGGWRVWSLVGEGESYRRQCHRGNRRTGDMGPYEPMECFEART